jgi:hypothetical protein
VMPIVADRLPFASADLPPADGGAARGTSARQRR